MNLATCKNKQKISVSCKIYNLLFFCVGEFIKHIVNSATRLASKRQLLKMIKNSYIPVNAYGTKVISEMLHILIKALLEYY